MCVFVRWLLLLRGGQQRPTQNGGCRLRALIRSFSYHRHVKRNYLSLSHWEGRGNSFKWGRMGLLGKLPEFALILQRALHSC